jgi:hypothetical protein
MVCAMSGPNVMVNFRLDRERPVRVRWLASDGVPGDGYKPQVTAILLRDGARLAMDGSAILEQTAPDPAGGLGGYLVTFTGMVGYAVDHADRARIDRLEDEDVDYELEFVAEDGRVAALDRDYQLIDRPRAHARKLTRRDA